MAVEQAEMPEIVEWRAKLEELFGLIHGWLGELDPPPSIEATTTTIIEHRSGEYEAPMLLVRRGRGEFRIRPIARWVVGAAGRVDLEGGDGPFILVRMVEPGALIFDESSVMSEIKDIDGWFWVQDRPPWHRVGLTGELFRGLAATCLE